MPHAGLAVPQVELAVKSGMGSPNHDDVFGPEAPPLIWGDFLRPGLER
jgi:hypothetical protein